MAEDDKNQVDKSLVVCRHDLIRDIDIFKLALGVSFEQSLYPTSAELCKAVKSELPFLFRSSMTPVLY
jgi:hypothetical protein